MCVCLCVCMCVCVCMYVCMCVCVCVCVCVCIRPHEIACSRHYICVSNIGIITIIPTTIDVFNLCHHNIHNLPLSIFRGMFLGCEEDSLTILLKSYEFHMTAAKHDLDLMAKEKEKEKESPSGAIMLSPPKKGQVHMIVQCYMNMTVGDAKFHFHIFLFL